MTKKEMCARAGAILSSGKVTPEDDAFLRDLIQGHPDAAEKVGIGIDHFEVRANAFYKTGCLWLVRVDGTETDFSYRKCVTGTHGTHRAQVLMAMRAAISDQVADFKRRMMTPGARCSLTGVTLDEETVHVDHDPPFVQLARDFFAEAGGADAIRITPSQDGSVGRTLLDPEMERRWGDFHRQRATLFLTTARANMRKGAKRNLSPASLARPRIGDEQREQETSK